IRGFDCVFCGELVEAYGSLDSTSDYIDAQGVEGTYVYIGISVPNVKHADLHDNYLFGYPVT
ncbi:MAG: hypothetical protein WBW81_00480, partial [Methylocella sp.]